MARVILITGGNRGDVKSRLQRAQSMINAEIGPVMRCSHRYKSAPWGFQADEPFSNQVLVADTDLSPREVLEKVQAIEQALGRDRAAEEAEKERTGQKYSSREIDVDILFYDDEVVADMDLVIPHPLLHERDFVLEPLCEVAPQKIHPVLGRTVAELWDEMDGRNGDRECD
ncbi:MAG: 2-amino-4-hydroxy-6-hydroxymethyldihydropteridine diphosphokinase [Alistipes sp.]|nr:2-amino-4-hydroxy-6-hydroxymethyldihydropteridine diphosphokinase [Alistipes sp.]